MVCVQIHFHGYFSVILAYTHTGYTLGGIRVRDVNENNIQMRKNEKFKGKLQK